MTTDLPIPDHFDPGRVSEIWRVPYEKRFAQARTWAREHGLAPAAEDRERVALVLVDVQNTFCTPGFELFVGGRSGTGAVEDNVRLCRFIYRNLHRITSVVATMDTHQAVQIFHAVFLIDADGNPPEPMTQVSADDVKAGRWRFNPAVAPSLGITPEHGQRHLEHYVGQLEASGKYALMIWPFHAMLGGIGHALVPAVEEAVFFHGIARDAQAELIVKGDSPLSEAYSVLGPEVREDPVGARFPRRDKRFVDLVRDHDAVYVAGQAKSHCVAWTVQDWLEQLRDSAPDLIPRVHLLEDTTSAVVVPGVADFTDDADEAFRRFAAAGMRVVQTT